MVAVASTPSEATTSHAAEDSDLAPKKVKMLATATYMYVYSLLYLYEHLAALIASSARQSVTVFLIGRCTAAITNYIVCYENILSGWQLCATRNDKNAYWNMWFVQVRHQNSLHIKTHKYDKADHFMWEIQSNRL